MEIILFLICICLIFLLSLYIFNSFNRLCTIPCNSTSALDPSALEKLQINNVPGFGSSLVNSIINLFNVNNTNLMTTVHDAIEKNNVDNVSAAIKSYYDTHITQELQKYLDSD